MKYVNRATGLFFVLCMVFIPFVHKPLQLAVTGFIFGEPVRWLCNAFYARCGRIDFSSDTRGLLLLLAMLALLAAVLALALKKHNEKLLPVLKTITVYFLAFVLLKYGLDKVFLRQFYEPAPNLLYTTLGNLDRDILYWSTVGVAPAYQIIMGSVEVLAALLLLFARTRFIGLLLATITLVQVVIINFTFDISVKMFSLLLLAMALYAAGPQLKALLAFLLSQKEIALPEKETIVMPVYIKAGLKCFFVGLMLLMALYPQLQTQSPKPELYGAYLVTGYEVNGKPIALHKAPVKRVFVHPKFYIIFQGQDDTVTDYHFTQNAGNEIEITGYNGQHQRLTCTKENEKLTLKFANGTVITATALPWQQLPALQPQFHFTVDGIE